MSAAFAAVGADLQLVGPLAERHDALHLARRAVGALTGRRYLHDRHPAVLDGFAHQVEEALAESPPDVAFSPGSIPLTRVRSRPTAFWTDATFGAMLDWYPHFARLSAAGVRAGHRQEGEALASASVAVYASRWAAQSALEQYGADPAKVHVIPFGANLASPPSPAEVEALVDARPDDRCRLVWIGSEWERKRGALAVEVAGALRARGLAAEITLAGAAPPPDTALPDHALHVGWVDKSTERGRAMFEALLAEAHFLLLPTTAEAFGIVFCEASAYGVPSLATEVGGVPDAVESGVNGVLLPLEAGAADFARAIMDVMGTPGRYRELAASSRRRFEETLNWAAGTRRALALMGTS